MKRDEGGDRGTALWGRQLRGFAPDDRRHPGQRVQRLDLQPLHHPQLVHIGLGVRPVKAPGSVAGRDRFLMQTLFILLTFREYIHINK
jgi:hypothetical protein